MAGRTCQQRFNTAVSGPLAASNSGITRDGNQISGALPLFTDGAGHLGYSDVVSATTTLYRNGKKIGSLNAPLAGDRQFKVPASDGAYRLTTSVKRSAALSAASSRVDATWTFRSKKPSDGLPADLPVSTVRFNAKTGLDSKVAAGKAVTYPVTVQGAAKGRNLKSLAVWVSYDHGRTWKKVTVTNGKITVKNPAKGKSVFLRAKVTDKKNNTSTITIHDAYHGK